jgi:predicted O-methyltransferase YrrM
MGWDHRPIRILEIGAFEGRTTRWMLEHAPKADVVVIDTFAGGDDQAELALDGLRGRFDLNIASHHHRLTVLSGRSDEMLSYLVGGKAYQFDFIYVDGSHHATDVLFDAVSAWRLLKIGGLMCFDDYTWHSEDPSYQLPRAAIDAFVHIYHDHLVVPRMPDRQCWVEKIS